VLHTCTNEKQTAAMVPPVYQPPCPGLNQYTLWRAGVEPRTFRLGASTRTFLLDITSTHTTFVFIIYILMLKSILVLMRRGITIERSHLSGDTLYGSFRRMDKYVERNTLYI